MCQDSEINGCAVKYKPLIYSSLSAPPKHSTSLSEKVDKLNTHWSHRI